MKLSLSIDLEPIRQVALNQVDGIYAARMTNLMTGYHIDKYEMALRTDEALLPEAQWRGVTLQELCGTIIAKHREAQAQKTVFDLERMGVKDQIRAATSEQEIRALVPGFLV